MINYAKTFVVYHDPCLDGMASCYAAWLALGDKATYIPWSHNDPVPDFGNEPAKIFCLDIAFTVNQYHELTQVYGHRIQIIDHHYSTMEAYKLITHQLIFEDKTTHIFDMDHSGAVLAWRYFSKNKPTPKFFKYIEDRDLWKKALPKSEEFTAAIMNKPKTIETYHMLANMKFSELIKIGKYILQENKYMLQDILKSHKLFAKFDGYDCEIPIINTNVLMSDVGNALLERYPMSQLAAYFQYQNDGMIKVGLRSNDRYDVSSLAIKYKGGGHKNAAAFIVSPKEFNERIKLHT